jgi:beta-lactam-binding protein with PASTA domain
MMTGGAMRSATAAEGGSVNLSVTVIDEKKRDVPNAIVTITYEGGAPIRLQTNDDGFATARITLPSGISALNVKAEHDRQSGSTTVRVRPETLTGDKRADLACTVALDPPPPTFGSTGTLRVIVNVVDSNGRAVPGASVNILRDEWGPDLRPWETHADADANGVAVLNVSLAAGNWFEGRLYWPVFRIDATKGDISASVQLKVPGNRVGSETRYPSELTTTIAFKNKDVTVAVLVTDASGNPIEGADVSIYRSDSARTGADGKANVRAIVYETRQRVEVAKEGYKPGSAPVNILTKDAGTTISIPPIKLEKTEGKALELIVHVTSADTQLPVPDVSIAFTPITGKASPFTLGTNVDGNASTRITAYGTFTVRLSQDNYEPLEQQVQIPYGEEQKKLEFKLREKATGDESVTITVLAGDSKNGRGGFQPIKGATVTAGKVNGVTDSSGVITFDVKAGIVETDKKEGYIESVAVTVSAEGYKSQSRSVSIARRGRKMAGAGAATFTLEAGEDSLSNTTPLKLIVEVRDHAGKAIPQAGVDFFLPDGTWLVGYSTNAEGKVEFLGSYVVGGQYEPSVLRNGLKVTVKKPVEYKDHESFISKDLLKPAKQNKYSVQLDKDWSALEKAVADFEKDVKAWRGTPQSVVEDVRAAHELGNKCTEARVRADRFLSELKTALKTFDARSFSNSCKEAADQVRAIAMLQREAKQKEEKVVATLKEATDLAARCKTAAESVTIRSKQKEAITLIGELGVLGRKAKEINDVLTRLADSAKEAGTLPGQLREPADKIQKEFEVAESDAMKAGDLFRSAASTSKSVVGQEKRLRQALEDLWVKYQVRQNRASIPKEILQRLTDVEDLLATFNNDASFGESPNAKWLEVVKDDVRRIQQARIDALENLSRIKPALCEIHPRNEAVEEIRTRLTNSSFELGLSADLPAIAQACADRDANDDMVVVPNLSVFDGIIEMKAAATHVGLVPGLAATKGTAPSGSKRLFAGQTPAAGSKAKRGSPLTILVYQSAAAPPAPIPDAVVSHTPNESDEVRVPDLSAFDNVSEMKAALAHVGLTGAFNAKGKPPSKEKEFKFAAQAPGADSRVKRGATVVVSVYQKFENGPEPTAPLETPPLATVAKGGTMPSLIGLTLEQATARLERNMVIGSDEIGAAPPSAKKAFTIVSQHPAAGEEVSASKRILISVKRYGAAQVAAKPKAVNKAKNRWPEDHWKPIGGDNPGPAPVDLNEWRRRNQPHR